MPGLAKALAKRLVLYGGGPEEIIAEAYPPIDAAEYPGVGELVFVRDKGDPEGYHALLIRESASPGKVWWGWEDIPYVEASVEDAFEELKGKVRG